MCIRDRVSTEEVGSIVARDIAMTAKLLKLVNSAFFGLGRPIANPAEAAAYLGNRDIAAIARSTEFNAQPDALCVSGLIAGAETDAGTLAAVKEAVQRTPVFANTGVRADNVVAQLGIADGAIVGTTFKIDGYIWSDVDERRVAEFMQAARTARG